MEAFDTVALVFSARRSRSSTRKKRAPGRRLKALVYLSCQLLRRRQEVSLQHVFTGLRSRRLEGSRSLNTSATLACTGPAFTQKTARDGQPTGADLRSTPITSREMERSDLATRVRSARSGQLRISNAGACRDGRRSI
jgi:hypothetical protein